MTQHRMTQQGHRLPIKSTPSETCNASSKIHNASLLTLTLLTSLESNATPQATSSSAWSNPTQPLSLSEQRFKPSLLLAKSYDRNVDLKAYWASEKLDGIRCYWDGQRLWTRGGRTISAPDAFTKGFPAEPLDGELWIDRQHFEAVSALARRKNSSVSEWAAVKFYAFDLPSQPLPFNQRLMLLQRQVDRLKLPTLKVVPHFKVSDHSTLIKTMNTVVQAGGEGLMLHRGESFYVGHRSDDLLKVKPYSDDEAIVMRHIAGKGKHKGRLGALLVKNHQGIVFKIGTGFSDVERENPPTIGSQITYRYFGKTSADKPRFASFLRIREPD